MKRDRRLRQLSDDHHQALVLARRATSATSDDPAALAALWSEVVRRFVLELEPHFAVEEQCLLPALERCGSSDLAARTRAEHAALRHLVSDTPLQLGSALESFGALLRDHVRFEERVLFNVAQETLSDEVLEAVAAASRTPEGANS